MEKWVVKAKRADFELWSRELGIDVVTARILRNRDIETLEEAKKFLSGSETDVPSPWLLRDMDKAVDCVLESIEAGEKIRIIGDYDVDGVTSSCILDKGLSWVGANVTTAIPHRIHDGYGLSEGLVTDAAKDGINLIITCDNGISAAEQVALANALGMKVVITDHHEVPFVEEGEERKQVLPEAMAIVNPKRYDCNYPFKGICGAMVAYKFIWALREKINKSGSVGANKIDDAKMDELKILAALGTVCDVMELKDENRIMVNEGIRLLKKSPIIGLSALMEVNSIAIHKLSSYHLGFIIGPCINATGRLDTAQKALSLLKTESHEEATRLARELKELNDSRKVLTVEGVEQAEKYIEEHKLEDRDVWVIYLPEVHESIAGIIAGRIREKYNHPVFILTQGEEGVKGSGRSIEGYHMQKHLVAVSALLDRFGGHAMAAGLSLKEEMLEEFESAVNKDTGLTPEDFVAKVSIDVPMPIEYASLKLAREISCLEPFGVGNPQPLFAQKDLEVVGIIPFGAENQYSRLKIRNNQGRNVEITAFDKPEVFYHFLNEKYGEGSSEKLILGNSSFKMSIAYQIGINNYHGENLQFMLKKFC